MSDKGDIMQGRIFEKEKRKKEVMFQEESNVWSYMEKNLQGEYLGTQTLFDKENGNLLMNRVVDENGNAKTVHYKGTQATMKCHEKLVNGEFVLHGPTERYRDGKVVEIGNYENGRKDGRWVTIDLETKKIEVKRYRNGEDISGESEKRARREMMSGVGTLLDSFEERSVGRATQTLLQNIGGLVQALERDKLPNIKVDFEQEPSLEIGKPEIGYSSFYPDGSLKVFAEKATKLENGSLQYEGQFLEHHDEGGLKTLAHYNERGELDGEYKRFYRNGKIKEKGQYINNEKMGLFQSYNKKGELQNEELFKGKKQGMEGTVGEEKKEKKKTKIPKKVKIKPSLKELLTSERERDF